MARLSSLVLKPGLQIRRQKFSLVMTRDAKKQREIGRVVNVVRLLRRGRHRAGSLDGLCRELLLFVLVRPFPGGLQIHEGDVRFRPIEGGSAGRFVAVFRG
jgi:hypothetical protein